MNQFEMVAIIVVAAIIAGIIKVKVRHGRDVDPGEAARESAENARLREEVKELKQRLQVLERITVEKENSLAREIEQLRDP